VEEVVIAKTKGRHGNSDGHEGCGEIYRKELATNSGRYQRPDSVDTKREALTNVTSGIISNEQLTVISQELVYRE
jgi:hypothetical protein